MHERRPRDAKKRLGELVRRAREEGPQTVTVHGKPAAAVVLHADANTALTKLRRSFTDFLLSGPAWPDHLVELINDRARDAAHDIEL